MENFDLDINFNGIESDIQYLNADGDGKETPENTETKETEPKTTPQKKSELATQIDKYTNLFKDLSGYETPADRQARLNKEKAEEGKRTTIFGLNPFVAIGISLALVVGGTIAIIKLKGK